MHIGSPSPHGASEHDRSRTSPVHWEGYTSCLPDGAHCPSIYNMQGVKERGSEQSRELYIGCVSHMCGYEAFFIGHSASQLATCRRFQAPSECPVWYRKFNDGSSIVLISYIPQIAFVIFISKKNMI